MSRLLPAVVFVLLASLATVASGRVALDVTCKTAEAEEAYADCAAGCKEASARRQSACNRDFRSCRAGRATCRKKFRDCSKAQRGKLRSCRADCLKEHDCKAGQ